MFNQNIMITLKNKTPKIIVHRYEFVSDKYGHITVDDYWKNGYMGTEIYDTNLNDLSDDVDLVKEVFDFLNEEGR